jgi:hypothetical protein
VLLLITYIVVTRLKIVSAYGISTFQMLEFIMIEYMYGVPKWFHMLEFIMIEYMYGAYV